MYKIVSFFVLSFKVGKKVYNEYGFFKMYGASF